MFTETQPVARLKVPLVLKAFLLVAASYCCAIYLNATTKVWQVIESAPLPLRDTAVKIILFMSRPFEPAEAHAQEELLELWLIWLFSAPVTILILLVTYESGCSVVGKFQRIRGRNTTAQ